MWHPLRSEAEVFRATVALALLAGVSALVGLASPIAGWAMFGVGVVAGLTFAWTRRTPATSSPLKEAADSFRVEGHVSHRILAVANESLESEELRRELMQRVELWPELFVVAPVLCSRAHYWSSDVDKERGEAARRLTATIAWARAQGFTAYGEVGDPDPVAAIQDVLRRFDADEVIIATHPPEHSSWLEAGVVDRVRSELDVPVTHVIVESGRARIAKPA
jgi:GABA permease